MRRTLESEIETLSARLDALQAVWAMTGKNELAHDYTAALYANQVSGLCKWGIDIDIGKAVAERWQEYLVQWLDAQRQLKAHDALYNAPASPQWHVERLELTKKCERNAWRLWQCERLLNLRDDAFVNALTPLLQVRRAA